MFRLNIQGTNFHSKFWFAETTSSAQVTYAFCDDADLAEYPRLNHMVNKIVHDALVAFVAERNWAQFHTPENLAKSVAIEAGELLECFQWSAEGDPKRVREELADVLTYCLLLADRIGVDPDQIVLEKLEITRKKYPVDKARGSSKKYDEL